LRRCMGNRGSTKNTVREQNKVVRYSKVHQGEVLCLARGPTNTVITGSTDGSATLFDFEIGKVYQYMRHGDKAVNCVQYGSIIGGVITGCRDTNVRLWRRDNSEATVFSGHSLVVTAVTLTEDNGTIISGSRDNCIKAWDVRTSKMLYSINETRNLLTDLKLVPHENILVQTSEDKRVRLWDTRNLDLIHVYPTKNYIQSCCDVSSDGMYVLSGSNGFNGAGCELNLWDIRTKKQLSEMKGHQQGVECVAFVPGTSSPSKLAVSGSKDSTLRVWDTETRHCILEKRLPGMGAVTGIVPFEDSSMVCSTHSGCVMLNLVHGHRLTESKFF